MYNKSQLYELSFVSLGRRPRTNPRIVFTTKAEYLTELNRRLYALTYHWQKHADDYCRSDVTFAYPSPDLFGHIEFGYGKCGFVNIDGSDARFEVELSKEKLHCCSMTIKLLLMALTVPVDEKPSNQAQQIDVEMHCDHTASVYGHAVGGYVSSGMIAWLREQGNRLEKKGNTPLPEGVTQAMRQAWATICSDERRQWTRECGGYITPDGRFILVCFGNSCDLSIYPDQMYGDMTDSSIQFSCHNLDQADQQITLLAGLAKLCELARLNE